MPSNKESVHYPTLYIDGNADLKDLPDSGEMTIKFKVVSRSCNERDGKKNCSISLDVMKICDVEEVADDSDDAEADDTETVLDRLAAEQE